MYAIKLKLKPPVPQTARVASARSPEVGQRFGTLTVLGAPVRQAGPRGRVRAYVSARCRCGYAGRYAVADLYAGSAMCVKDTSLCATFEQTLVPLPPIFDDPEYVPERDFRAAHGYVDARVTPLGGVWTRETGEWAEAPVYVVDGHGVVRLVDTDTGAVHRVRPVRLAALTHAVLPKGHDVEDYRPVYDRAGIARWARADRRRVR